MDRDVGRNDALIATIINGHAAKPPALECWLRCPKRRNGKPRRLAKNSTWLAILLFTMGRQGRESMMKPWEHAGAVGFSPHIGQQAPRTKSTLGLVAAGLGIALVPASMQTMGMDGVVCRRLNGAPQPKAVLGLVSQRGDPSAVVRQFLNLVKRDAKVHPTD